MSLSNRFRRLIAWLRCLRKKGTCDLRFSLQGRYPSVLDLRIFGITNTALTIHGSALHAGKGITIDDFINRYNETDLSKSLHTYLDHNQINPGRNHLLILDMEPSYPDPNDPNGERQIQYSPSDLGEYDDALRDQLIRAYIRRIKVARNVLRERWPRLRLKLGLYGVVIPMGKGQENDAFQRRMKAYLRAGELGMYDFLDNLIPVVYTGFGPSDVDIPDELDKLHTWIEKATRQAISHSQQLTQSNGNKLPLAPILTFWVTNGKSAHHKKIMLPETMSLQLRILREYCSDEILVFWSGSETIEEMRDTEFEPFDIPDFLARVEGLPIPGCRRL